MDTHALHGLKEHCFLPFGDNGKCSYPLGISFGCGDLIIKFGDRQDCIPANEETSDAEDKRDHSQCCRGIYVSAPLFVGTWN